MAVSIFGYGSASAQKSLAMAQNAAAISAARLSSGMRTIAGGAASGDMAAYGQMRAEAAALAINARAANYAASIAVAFDGVYEQLQAIVERGYLIAQQIDTNTALTTEEIATLTAEATELSADFDLLAAQVINTYALGDATLNINLDQTGAAYLVTFGATVTAAPDFTVIADAQSALTEILDGRATLAGAITGVNALASMLDAQASSLSEGAANYIATDYAAETANLTLAQILQQSAAAMLAQANQSANIVLALLK